VNSTVTAHQLYPASRTDRMSLADLESVQRFALADRAETSKTVYAGMTRHETVLTAQRTIDDTQAAISRIHAALVPAW
jgi:hypothetical protein